MAFASTLSFPIDFLRLEHNPVRNKCREGVYGDAFLLHGIPEAYGHAMVGFRIKVVCHAKRSAYLILPPVPLSDGTAIVVIGHKAFSERVVDVLCGGRELF